jgi:hypothetical protein
MAQNAQNSDFLPAIITRSWLNQFAYGWPDFKLKVLNQQASYLPKRPNPDACPCIFHRKMSTSGCENRPSLVTASFNVIPSFSDPAFFALTKKSFSCNFRVRQELRRPQSPSEFAQEFPSCRNSAGEEPGARIARNARSEDPR